jgi:hypothetical protein
MTSTSATTTTSGAYTFKLVPRSVHPFSGTAPTATSGRRLAGWRRRLSPMGPFH